MEVSLFGYLIIIAILTAWYWLVRASLTQIIRNESGDPTANVTTKEVIVYMVLSLLVMHTASEIVKKLKK